MTTTSQTYAAPNLHPEVRQAFVTHHNINPILVIVVTEGGDEIIFEVDGFPLTQSDIDFSKLKLASMTIQDASNSCTKVVCNQYGCFRVSC